MQLSQALDRTLEHYGISGTWLAERSGVSRQMISQFRHGKQRIMSDSLEKIIESLPPDARTHFFSLLGSSPTTMRSAIEIMDNIELAILLNAIAEKLHTGKTQHLISA